MRFVVRTIGLVLLAVGVVFAVGDMARYLADETIRLASIAEAFASLGWAPDPAGAADPRIGEAAAAILRVPAAIGFGLLGLLLLVLGRAPRRMNLRRAGP